MATTMLTRPDGTILHGDPIRASAEPHKHSGFIVQAPFDADPQADVVLRSSDGVDFRVIKCILGHSSAVFKDMFTLPQPVRTAMSSSSSNGALTFGSSIHDVHENNGLPIVPMSESNAVTLDAFLRILYPFVSQEITDLDIISDLLKTALKYDVYLVVEQAQMVLYRACASDDPNPMKAYVIACCHRLEVVARLAAYATLKRPFSEAYITEFARLSGTEFYRIFDYHRKVVDSVRSLFVDEQYGTSFCYEMENAIVDHAQVCPHRVRGKIMMRTNYGSGFVDVEEQVYLLGWWASLRNAMFAEIPKGPIAEKLLTYEMIWTEGRDCCIHCQRKVERALRYGFLENLMREMRMLVTKVDLGLPWD